MLNYQMVSIDDFSIQTSIFIEVLNGFHVLMPEFLLYLDGHDFPPFRIYLTYTLMTNHL